LRLLDMARGERAQGHVPDGALPQLQGVGVGVLGEGGPSISLRGAG
jgi:hypothetical protein